MSKPYPQEFGDDVVRVGCNRGDGVTIEQVATDFGVHVTTLRAWLRQGDIDVGTKPGKSTGDSAELGEAATQKSVIRAGKRGFTPGSGVFITG